LLIVTQEIFKKIALAKLENRPVIAIGTTMVRYLESLLYIWPLIAEQIDLDHNIHAWWQHQSDTMIAKNAEKYAPPSKFRLRKGLVDGIATAETSLFIYPGYRFGIVDQIITNFHLPNSTLMPMIAAFIGIDTLKQAYEIAKNEGYRFYSFGDGMWIKNPHQA
ncbi:MAG: S-adenosylmethionine:tRNA ribosyltransferase-isomerase, partial [Candidatus Gracilibacteria bacterium]|nr:S-adenosylmethionine:tRNA ribosyltransferase-isomerase [Candidatus Gracilibacteria bacterium]